MRASMMEIVPRFEKRTHYLGTFANLATLLGLLGTVSGLDSRLYRGGDGQSGGEGQPPRGEYFRGDELYSVRPRWSPCPLLFIHAFLQTQDTRT